MFFTCFVQHGRRGPLLSGAQSPQPGALREIPGGTDLSEREVKSLIGGYEVFRVSETF